MHPRVKVPHELAMAVGGYDGVSLLCCCRIGLIFKEISMHDLDLVLS